MGQQNCRLGSEDQRVVKDAPVKRFLAEAIACDEQPTPSTVPESEGKHAVELSNHCVAVLFVQVRQHLGIRSTAKSMSTFFEIGTQLAIVIDLAVEDYGDAPIFVEDRLFTRDEVDDRQPSHPKRRAARDK